jgi:glutathione S-transferase
LSSEKANHKTKGSITIFPRLSCPLTSPHNHESHLLTAPSPPFPGTNRQTRKVTGGIRALAIWVDKATTTTTTSSSSPISPIYLINNTFSIADIAACSALGYLAVRWPEIPWQKDHPQLKAYWEAIEATRESFGETRPEVHVINDRIV